MAKTNVFRDIFCDHPFRNPKQSSQVPIYFDLELIQNAWKEIQFDENGNLNFESLKNGEYEKYIPALRNIAEVCMPYLSVKENPNKFLKLALDYREKNMVFVRPNDMKNKNENDFQFDPQKQLINSPTLSLYIGLDRIAQFLNFCVLINSLSTKKENGVKKVEPLSFEKEVLKELLEQVKTATQELKSEIEKYNTKYGKHTLNEFKTELNEYRKQYDEYVVGYEKNNENQNIFDVLTFVEWMDNAISNANGMSYSGLQNNDYDKTKLNILLSLDSIHQCETAIDNFINSNALESSILDWFKEMWNSLVHKIGLSQKWLCNIETNTQLMPNKIIPNLGSTGKTRGTGSKLHHNDVELS
ncbi:MAG: hypothetical protein IJU86_00730 [Firmicutes bacterium]|nr:hypothetical protein [Bacillota bacterium]